MTTNFTVKRITLFFLGMMFCTLHLFAQRAIIQFNAPLTTTPAITKAALRYDKDFAYSFTIDDGALDAFTTAYPAIMGGTVQGNGLAYSGLYYTDGCGNQIPFKAGLAWNAANIYGIDSHDGLTPDKMTWTQLDSLYNRGWDVFNHSFTHKAISSYPNMTNTDYVNEVTMNGPAITAKTKNKIKTPLFVVPSGDVNYHSVAYAQGQTVVFDQAGNDLIGYGGIPVTNGFSANGQFIHRQDLEPLLSTNTDKISGVAASANNANNIWYNEFFHHMDNFDSTASFNFYKFRTYMERVANTWGKNGSDRMWMAPLQEVYEYLTMRNTANYVTSLNGNQLILDFDLNSVPTWVRRKSISMVVTGNIDFSNVTVPANVKVSFKGTGARRLINFEFLDSAPTSTCANDATPPVITNCPANVTVSTAGASATASWTVPTVTDNCTTTAPTLTSNYSPGATFPVGRTTVVYTAKDGNNNTASCSFNVNVSSSAGDICSSPTSFIKSGANSIIISGITSSAASVQVFSGSWDRVIFQNVILTNTLTIPNVPAGAYNIKVSELQPGGQWPAICNVEINQFQVSSAPTDPCSTDTQAPTFANCPASISLASTGTLTPSVWTTPTATDNCTTAPVISSNYSSGSSFPVGTTLVSYTAKDAKGNTGTCNFNVVVSAADPCLTDIQAPTFSNCPASISLASTGTLTPSVWTTPTATDNCTTAPVISSNYSSGSSFPVGTTLVSYTAKDAKGNTGTCNFNVVVSAADPCLTDIQAPTFSNCPSNISLASTGTLTPSVWTTPTATDNCTTAPVISSNYSSGSSFPVGTTLVSYTAKDAKGNTGTCNFNVVVSAADPCLTDIQAPTFSNCPSNISLASTGTLTPSVWTTPTATDNCTTAPVISSNYSSGSSFPVGTTLVSYTAKDAKGNTGTCNFNVVVSAANPCLTDTQAPTIQNCPANISLTATGTTAVASWTTPTVTDNCTTAPTVSSNYISGSSFPIGTTLVTYTAKDAKNNSSTCSFNVTVTGNTATGDICSNPTGFIKGGTNSITVSGITTSSAIVQVFTYPAWGFVANPQTNQSSITIPNLAQGTYIVRVTELLPGGQWPSQCVVQLNNVVVSQTVANPCDADTQAPTIQNCPANISLTTTGSTVPATWLTPLVTDNCTTTPTLTSNYLSGSAFSIGTTNVVYTATDAKNNKSTCNFNIVVSAADPCLTDTQVPTIQNCPANINLTTTGTTMAATWSTPLASDNCTATPTLTSNYSSGSAFPIGTTNVVYTATDAKNNKSTCLFTVTVSAVNLCDFDTQAPTIQNCPANINLTTTGTTMPATWLIPVATDNCSAVPTLSSNYLPGSVFPIGTTNVVYTATDAKNNKSTCFFTVTVSAVNLCDFDTQAPTIQNCPANIELTTTNNSSIASWNVPTVTDNCTTTPTLTSNHLPGSIFPVGATAVTYTAKDIKNNTSTCNFTVNVIGVNICTSPKNFIKGGNNLITITGIKSASAIVQISNAAGINVFNQQISTDSLTISNIASGTYNAVITILQPGGVFPAQCTISFDNITVSQSPNPCDFDIIAPVIQCPANMNLASAGTTVIANWIVPAAIDNCTVTPSVTSTETPGSAFPIGSTTVTYTAKDAMNNTSSCNFVVNVTAGDICTTPNLFIKGGGNVITITGIKTSAANIQVYNSAGAVVYFKQVNTDNVTITNLLPDIYSVTVTLLQPGGTFPVQCVSSLNSVTVFKSANACDYDVTLPTIQCPPNVNTTTTTTTAVVNWNLPTAKDNCTATPVITGNYAPGASFPIGSTIVSYTAKDAMNNTANCSFFVNVTTSDICTNPTAFIKGGGNIITVSGIKTLAANIQVTNPLGTIIYNKLVNTETTVITNLAPNIYTVTVSPLTSQTNGTPLCNVSLNNITVFRSANTCDYDITLPVVQCPADINLTSTGTTMPATWATPIATDNCIIASLTSNYTSGATFPVGTTTVTYTAKDAMNNTATCNFNVVIQGTVSTCRQTDSLALVDLYNSTNGTKWTANWNLNRPMSTWYGVTLTAEGCVQSINMGGNGLKGSLPASIGTLKSLNLLSLPLNQLSGTIPPALANLSSLTYLRLDNNALTGSVLPSLGNLTKLTTLSLANNQLSGCLSDSLKTLCSKSVSISGNAGLPNSGDWASFCQFGFGSCSSIVSDIALTVSTVNTTYRPFTTTNFKILAENKGTTVMSGIKVRFPYPANTVKGGTAVPSVGTWNEYCTGGTLCYEWSIPSIAPGASANLSIPLYIVSQLAPITVTSTLTGSAPIDAITTNNTSTLTLLPVTTPVAFITKPSPGVPVVIQSIAPNPTDGDLNVELESIVDKEVIFYFYNTLGLVDHTEIRHLTEGRNTVQFDVWNLQNGIYFIQINEGQGKNVPVKFVKL